MELIACEKMPKMAAKYTLASLTIHFGINGGNLLRQNIYGYSTGKKSVIRGRCFGMKNIMSFIIGWPNPDNS